MIDGGVGRVKIIYAYINLSLRSSEGVNKDFFSIFKGSFLVVAVPLPGIDQIERGILPFPFSSTSMYKTTL